LSARGANQPVTLARDFLFFFGVDHKHPHLGFRRRDIFVSRRSGILCAVQLHAKKPELF